ncbi:uncharacterized protein LOC123896653 [Trifolium pratense]|nr:uncharacterized protein LOC123896653 [Trifolium pratense]
MKGIKKEETKCAQMTIFYDGKVIVLDDIPDEKAKDIMVFSTDNYAAYLSFLPRNSVNIVTWMYNILEDMLDLYHNVLLFYFVFFAFMTFVFIFSNLPMTRKASLQWFLEKRKNRASYQTTYPVATTNKRVDESWHGSS